MVPAVGVAATDSGEWRSRRASELSSGRGASRYYSKRPSAEYEIWAGRCEVFETKLRQKRACMSRGV